MYKNTDPLYNKGEYINNKIKNQGLDIYEDIVNVEGYEFKIDRDTLKIIDTEISDNFMEKISVLSNKIGILENRTTMKSIVNEIPSGENNSNIPNATNTKILSITMPEDSYVDVYGMCMIQNDDSKEYKGISIYVNDAWKAGNGKGGNGGETTNDVSCLLELKKGDVVSLYVSQFTGQSKAINYALLRVNYFPINYNAEVPKLDENEDIKIRELKQKVTKLENRTTMKNITNAIPRGENNIAIPSGSSTEILSTTIPEDCYADIYGWGVLQNDNSENYKNIIIYVNDVLKAANGKGGNGGEITEDINCILELKKGDVVKLCLTQYTGQSKTINSALLRINYFPIDAGITEESSSNKEIEEEIEELEVKVAKLEEKTIMKKLLDTIPRGDNNPNIPNATNTKILSITIPEDCYAYIYGVCVMQNDDSENYKDTSIWVNNIIMAGNGKGGKGGETSNDVSCMLELKKGDKIDLYANQFTGENKKVNYADLRINYFKK